MPFNLFTIFNNKFNHDALKNIILWIVIIVTFFYQTDKILSLKKNEPLQKTAPLPMVEKKKTSLVHWHIFGKESKAAAEPSKWVLRGVLLGNPSSKNQAILASTDTDEQSYVVGNTLPDNSIIISISADSVRLSRNGAIETLYLDWKEEEKMTASEVQTSPEQGVFGEGGED